LPYTKLRLTVALKLIATAGVGPFDKIRAHALRQAQGRKVGAR
jgi:hypothetical protein